MPKISVIIPAYNSQQFITRCLYSILQQDLKDIEIIVIDDNSSDDTLLKINQIAQNDTRIKVIENSKNLGPSACRNIGLAEAKGEYIQFIDSDDWMDKNYLKTAYELAKKNDLDILVSNFIYVTDINIQKYDLKDINYISNIDYLRYIFKNQAYFAVWNKLFKAKLFDNIKFNQNINYGEDMLILIELILNSKKISKKNINSIYYYHNVSGISRDAKYKNYGDLLKAIDMVKEKLIKNNLYKILRNDFEEFKFKAYFAFISIKPFWENQRYLNDFETVYKYFNTKPNIAKNMTVIKKIIAFTIIKINNKRFLKFLINFINLGLKWKR